MGFVFRAGKEKILIFAIFSEFWSLSLYTDV